MVFAGHGKGTDKKGNTPDGYTKGNKTGWQGSNTPPGLNKNKHKNKHKNKYDGNESIKKGNTKQYEQNQSIEEGRNRVKKAAKKRGLNEKEAESAADDFEKATRRGLDPAESESMVKNKLKKGKKGDELSESMRKSSKNRIKKRGTEKEENE